ncbi:TPA: ATP-dependent RecD-like DNA helicase [Bacillus pacificus]
METHECGKQSVLVQDKTTKEMYGFVAQCKRMDCDSCGTRIQTYVQNKIAMYTKKFNLKHFATITMGDSDIKNLLKKFGSLVDKTRELEKEYFIKRYISRKRSTREIAEKKYYEYVHSLYDQEHYYRWLYGKDLSKKEKNINYVPISNFGYQITKMLTQRPARLQDQIKVILEMKHGKKLRKNQLEKYYKDNVESQRKKWVGWSYADTKKEGRREEFLNDFHVLLTDIAMNVYTQLYPNEDERTIYRSKIPKENTEMAYIRTIEFHNTVNAAHIHSLFNFYIPIKLLKSVMGNHVYDMAEISNLASENLEEKCEEEHDFHQYVARYVSKYITKSSLEVYEKLKEEGEDRVNIISSSDNISIVLEEAFESPYKGKFQLLSVVKGVLPQHYMKFSTIQEFQYFILDSIVDEHPNQYIDKTISYFKDYFKEARKKGLSNRDREIMKEELKENENELLQNALKLELERRSKEIFVPKQLKLRKTLKQGSLTIEQFEALQGITSSDLFSFLIGYAGTGKTYTLSTLLDYIDFENHDVAVVSYTAQATQRVRSMLKEQKINVDNLEINTIHKLCGAKHSMIDYPIFYNDWSKPLPYSFVIIDEFSLIDIRVLTSFLASLKPTTKVLFVGDPKQLNPIHSKHPYFYLKDFAGVYELTKVLRSGDKIIDIATSVRNGDIEKVPFEVMDFKNSEEKIAEYKKRGYQVLSNSVALKDWINNLFQKDKKQIQSKFNYAQFDNIIFIKNDQYKRYVNGEKGQIIAYNEFGVTIRTENNNEVVLKDYEFFNRVEPNHCLTVHKSQGSEYDKVLVLLDATKTLLLNRNLLYTGITRAKTDVVVMINKVDDKVKTLLKQEQE